MTDPDPEATAALERRNSIWEAFLKLPGVVSPVCLCATTPDSVHTVVYDHFKQGFIAIPGDDLWRQMVETL